MYDLLVFAPTDNVEEYLSWCWSFTADVFNFVYIFSDNCFVKLCAFTWTLDITPSCTAELEISVFRYVL